MTVDIRTLFFTEVKGKRENALTLSRDYIIIRRKSSDGATNLADDRVYDYCGSRGNDAIGSVAPRGKRRNEL